MEKESACRASPPALGGLSHVPHLHARFDFRKRVAYDPEAKRLFHTQARRQLLALAAALDLATATTISAPT